MFASVVVSRIVVSDVDIAEDEQDASIMASRMDIDIEQ